MAEISKHDAKFIMSEMPYARGLQFRTIYWLTRTPPIEVEPVGGTVQSSLKTIIQ